MDLKGKKEKVERLKSEIDALRPIPVDLMGKIMQKFRLDWNFHSNSIEGNSLTFGETKTFLLHGLTAQGKPLKDHLDIKGHNEAVLWLDEVIKEKRPLTETFIRELHEMILKEPYRRKAISPEGQETTREIRIGEYKTTPNHVKTVTGEIFYFASPEETPAKMEKLMQWYREESEKRESPAYMIAALFHYKFIRIHPFDDGNGRMARLLMNLILMGAGFPPVIIRSDGKKKEVYYSALRQADGGDLDAFVWFILDQLEASCVVMLRGAKGGNIKEEEDFNKRLSLLKQSLTTSPDFVKKEVEENEIIEIINKSFVPLSLKVNGGLSESFSDFFKENSTKIIANEGEYQSINLGFLSPLEHDSPIQFLEQWSGGKKSVHRPKVQADHIETLQSTILFSELKTLKNRDSIRAGFKFRFFQFSWEIDYNVMEETNPEFVLEKKYGEQISSNEIDHISHHLKNSFLDLLENSLEK